MSSPARLACWILLLASAPAMAADWVRVPAPGGDRHFYDRSKLSIETGQITYWRKVDFARPPRVGTADAKSAMYHERIDCRRHTVQALAWQVVSDDGSILERTADPGDDAQPVAPDTVGDRFHGVMCALVAEQEAREGGLARIRADLAACRNDLDAADLALTALRTELEVLRAREATASGSGSSADPVESPR